jgi:hypothetical protein
MGQHIFPIAVVKNKRFTPNRARIDLSVEPTTAAPEIPDDLRIDMGSNSFELERTTDHLSFPTGSTTAAREEAPIRVWFLPKRSGRFRGDIVVNTIWENGRRRHDRIDVTAGARRLDEAPKQPSTPAPVARGSTDPKQGKSATTEQSNVMVSYVTDASNAAVHLANEQEAGLDKAHEEILGASKPAVPKPSLFSILADLALTMTVGGLAQVIGKFVAQNLVAALKGIPEDQVRNHRITDGLGSSIKDGLKSALGVAMKQSANAGFDTASRGAESADPRVDFFARQRTVLNQLATANAALLTEEQRRLAPVVGEAPDAVNQVFITLKRGFDDAVAGTSSSIRAQDRQARETVAQWTKGLAQHSLGTSTAERDGNKVATATDLSRPTAATDARGLVEIYATMDGDRVDPAKLKLQRGELHGVAQAAANRLATTPLRDLRIPIRIVVRSSAGNAYITRDEIGRVHVEGDLPAQDPLRPWVPSNHEELRRRRDAQLNRDAEALCETVLGWNVSLATDMPIPGL